jgi:hydroxymethylbilane synthase
VRTNIVVGSRGSKLALIQAELVASKIREANPHLEVGISKVITKGDRDRRTRLDWMTEVGIFVKELEEALLDGRIDVAVHSLKDVPTELPRGLCLLAVTERIDPRDIMVSKSKLDDLSSGSRIGTGSLRRTVQLAQYRSDLEVCSIRGNVDTRLGKVSSGEVDGVILAAAAMLRLGWENRITEYLPVAYFLPAVGQAALTIEARLDDKELVELVSPINHLSTWQSIAAERAFLSALGGGCRAPIGALGSVNGNTLQLEGMVADASGKKVIRIFEVGNAVAAEQVGMQLAQKMLAMGAAELLADMRAG